MSFFKSAFSSDSHYGKLDKDWIPESVMRGGGFGPSSSGINVSEATILSNSAGFACQRVIAESLAILPRKMYKKLPGQKREDVEKHSAIKILTREANPLQTSYYFFNNAQRHALSAGNAYAEIQLDRKTGEPIAFWPLPPMSVKPNVVDDGGDLALLYEITMPDGSKKYLTQDRVLHIPGIGFNGIEGVPLINFMINAAGLGQALEDFSALFFKQGAGINGYVSVPDSFDLDQIQNMRTQVGILNDGLDNAHRWKFLYESAKFTPTGATPEQAQMISARVFQLQEFCRFYRMPLHKIQETSKSTSYNSLEQFNTEFVSDCLQPWITNWEQEINRKCFDIDDGIYIKFNVNAILRGNADARASFYRSMVFSSIMTPNEARALEDLPPIVGGDERLVPTNMMEEGGSSNKKMDANERIQD